MYLLVIVPAYSGFYGALDGVARTILSRCKSSHLPTTEPLVAVVITSKPLTAYTKQTSCFLGVLIQSHHLCSTKLVPLIARPRSITSHAAVVKPRLHEHLYQTPCTQVLWQESCDSTNAGHLARSPSSCWTTRTLGTLVMQTNPAAISRETSQQMHVGHAGCCRRPSSCSSTVQHGAHISKAPTL
jgi:hypothetical protein